MNSEIDYSHEETERLLKQANTEMSHEPVEYSMETTPQKPSENGQPGSLRSGDLLGGLETPVLQSDHQCVLCAGCETDSNFDYCRACGFVPPVSNEIARKYLNAYPEPPPKGTLARAVWDARGGPAPVPVMRGFA